MDSEASGESSGTSGTAVIHSAGHDDAPPSEGGGALSQRPRPLPRVERPRARREKKRTQRSGTPSRCIHVHFPELLSACALPRLLQERLQQDGQQQLWRSVEIVPHERRQEWLRSLRDGCCTDSSAQAGDLENPNVLSELLAVEKLMQIAPQTCVLCMPTEIVTHAQLVQRRRRTEDSSDRMTCCEEPASNRVYRRMLLLPLYTTADLASEEEVSGSQRAASGESGGGMRCRVQDLPRRVYGLMQEVKGDARIVCILEGVRAALAIPQPHISTSVEPFEDPQAGFTDPGSLSLAGGSQQRDEGVLPSRTQDCPVHSLGASTFSAESLDEMICMLLIEWGVDTQEPLNSAGTATFLFGALKQLRAAAVQLSELPLELQQRVKKRRQMSLSSAVIVSDIAADADLGVPLVTAENSRPTASPPGSEGEAPSPVCEATSATEQNGGRAEAEGTAALPNSKNVWGFACRLWAEQLMQISGVTDKVASAVIRRFRRPAALLSELRRAEAAASEPTSPGGASCPLRSEGSCQVAKKHAMKRRRQRDATAAEAAAIVNELASLEAPSAFLGLTRCTDDVAAAGPPRALKVGKARAEKICRLFRENVDGGSIL
ncbi:hypothetical protein BESB_077010 [Besnoitia besnoiti]|uniref:Uncharacterized protein n=1 Tax=Besnoitia besnoiti TaxID=94643 RepID=A0A2A9M8J1_BESBE|nr:hypothetical protein BESB_077010 [Besnoitia besnoiti]PFH33484.1 hypothetical protein BESB_077010 [Besnoitia besnoiti]